MNSYIKTWSKAAAVRAIKTAAQTAVALIPVSITITEVDWAVVAGTAALAAVLSILTSVAGLPEVNEAEELDALETEVDTLKDLLD